MRIKIIKNPDEEYAAEIIKRIKNNNGHCPCKLIKDKTTKCRCKEFRDMVADGYTGECHCGLWIAEEY